MKCYKNLNQIITLSGAHDKDGRLIKPEDLSIIEKAAVVFSEDEIMWVGASNQIPDNLNISETIDLSGHVLVPEIVDSHTHLVFGGNRSKEYTMRLNGADYEEIGKAGGGILSTMAATVAASKDELYILAKERIDRISSYGIGTIEIKSGYALTYEKEKEITLLIDKLKKEYSGKVQIINTFMAAHAVPNTHSSSQSYIDEIVIPLMTELKDKIDIVDIFHEDGYFNNDDLEKLFTAAKKIGLNVKSHSDEFNDNKGAVLSVDHGALSCDHLLCTTKDGVEALSKSNTVATLLPGTAYFLGKPLPNARVFLDSGCKVALASDYNPGSSHCDNLLLVASISAKNLGFNIGELWSSICLNSAHSLNLKKQGAIKPGLKPRFTVFKCETIDEVTYNWGRNFAVSIS